jgi:hypothetical protein
MNTGIQDAHNLIWKIATVLRSENSDFSEFTERLLASYESERRPVARLNATISVQNFEKTLRIPRALGLDLNTANLLSRWLDRIPGPRALKYVCFQAAMKLGLKQVDWLNLNYSIGRHRRRSVRTMFEDAKNQTLQLLFPGQDLGFVYKEGWLAGRDISGTDQLDPLTFEPDLKLGGRMPHFWLADRDGQKISVLDLPSLMIGAERFPCFVLLIAGKAEMTPKVSNITNNRNFQPIVIAEIGLQSELQNKAHFSFYRESPYFLSSSFAVLMRPDGHIAWMDVPNRFSEPHTQFVAKERSTLL